MNKEKQIEEMAKVMCGYYGTEKCYECRYCCDCHIKQEATRLYNAGYRKQRTAEWVTTAETEDGLIVRYTHRCTDCNYFYKTVRPRGDDYCRKCGAKMKGGE